MLKPANNMPAIVQIVPRRTVQPEGIGDYATLLANALFERSGCRSVFLIGTPAEIEPPVKDAWDNSPVTSQKGSVLSKQLTEVCRETEAKAVLLHVSGYGYQKRGVPFLAPERYTRMAAGTTAYAVGCGSFMNFMRRVIYEIARFGCHEHNAM